MKAKGQAMKRWTRNRLLGGGKPIRFRQQKVTLHELRRQLKLREQKFRFYPGARLADLQLSEEDRQFVEERYIRERNARRSDKILCRQDSVQAG